MSTIFGFLLATIFKLRALAKALMVCGAQRNNIKINTINILIIKIKKIFLFLMWALIFNYSCKSQPNENGLEIYLQTFLF